MLSSERAKQQAGRVHQELGRPSFVDHLYDRLDESALQFLVDFRLYAFQLDATVDTDFVHTSERVEYLATTRFGWQLITAFFEAVSLRQGLCDEHCIHGSIS